MVRLGPGLSSGTGRTVTSSDIGDISSSDIGDISIGDIDVSEGDGTQQPTDRELREEYGMAPPSGGDTTTETTDSGSGPSIGGGPTGADGQAPPELTGDPVDSTRQPSDGGGQQGGGGGGSGGPTGGSGRQPPQQGGGQPDTRPLDTSQLSPGQRARLQQAQTEQRRNLADQLGPQVQPWEIDTETVRRNGGVFIQTEPTDTALADMAAAEAERNLSIEASIWQDPTDPGPGGVNIDPTTVERGEDFTVDTSGPGVEVNVTDQFTLEQTAKNLPGADAGDLQITEGGVEPTEGFIKEQAAENVRDQLGKPGWEAGSEFTVDVGEVSGETADLADTAGTVAGAFSPGAGLALDSAGFEEGQRFVDVELTPQGRRFRTRDIAAAEGELGGQEIVDLDQISFNEQGRVTGVRGPEVGELAAAERPTLDLLAPGAGGDIIGGAETLAAEAGAAVQDPVGAVLGPPGLIESTAGDVAFDAADVSSAAAGEVRRGVVDPFAANVGEAAESIPLQPTTTYIPGVGRVGTTQTAEQIADVEERGPGPETVAGSSAELFTGSAGDVLVESTVGLPAGAVEGGAYAADVGEFGVSQVAEEGQIEGSLQFAEAGVDVSTQAAGQAFEFAQENPGVTAAVVGGGALGAATGGLAAGRAIQRAPSLARSASIRARGGSVFDEADLADPPRRVMGGELPGFSRQASASPRLARAEFETQTRSGALAQQLDEPVAYSVRGADAVEEFGGFGRQFDAPAGNIPMNVARGDPPGLFFSGDISRLRLPSGSTASRPSIGLPRPRLRAGRVAAEADPDIGIIQSRDLGSAYEFMSGPRAGQAARAIQRGEDVDVSDIDFTTGPASRQQSFVRGGTLTPEQEAIAPPGAPFEGTGQLFGVRAGGEIVPGRVFRRATDVGDEAADVGETVAAGDVAGDVTRARETARVASQQPRNPILPPPVSPGGLSEVGSIFDGPTPTVGNVTNATGAPSPTPTEPTPTPTATESPTPTAPDTTIGFSDPTPSPFTQSTVTATEPVTQPTPPTQPTADPTPSVTEPVSEPSQPSPPSSPFGPTPTPSRPVSTPSRGGVPPRRSGGGGGPPNIPGAPGGGPPQRPLRPESDTDSDDEEDAFIAPTGQQFVNPIATGGQLLFGDVDMGGFGGGGDDNDNPDPTGLFLG